MVIPYLNTVKRSKYKEHIERNASQTHAKLKLSNGD